MAELNQVFLKDQIMVSRSWIFNDLSFVISNALIQDVESKKTIKLAKPEKFCHYSENKRLYLSKSYLELIMSRIFFLQSFFYWFILGREKEVIRGRFIDILLFCVWNI